MPLVSSMFKITASDELPVPVTVRMEHCAIIEEDDSLVHMIAHGPPPYQFRSLPEGKFPLGECYGEIQMKTFCTLTQAQKRRGSMSLSVHIVYHIYCSATFIATRNLRTLNRAVKKRYADAIKVVEQSMSCDHSTEAITLRIPRPKPRGWFVQPEFEPPKIQTRLIREYREGKIPPCIHLSMTWTGEGVPVEEKVKIAVVGTSVKSFFLSCRPAYVPDRSLASLSLSPQRQSAPLSPQIYTSRQSQAPTSLHTPFTHHTDTPRLFQAPTSLHTPFTHHTDTPRLFQTPTSLHTPFTHHTDTPRLFQAPTSLHTPFTHHTDTPRLFQTPTSLHTPFTYHTDTPRLFQTPTSPHTPFTYHTGLFQTPTSFHTPFTYHTDTPRQFQTPTSLHTPFTYHTDTPRQSHAPTSLHTPFTRHTDTPRQSHAPTSLHTPFTYHTDTPHQFQTPTSLHTPPTQHTCTPHQSQTPTSPPNQPTLGVPVPPRSPVQSGTKSVELKALKRSSDVFCGGVDPNTLATKLMAEELFTSEEHESATQRTATNHQRNNEILIALERRVSADNRVFHTVVGLLQQEPALKAVGDRMQGEF